MGSNRSLRKILLYALVPAIAALITWLTGSLVYWYGGFPLYWKIPCYLMRICSLSGPCNLCGFFYDWSAFIYDLLFYTALGYSLLFAYVVYDHQRQLPQSTASKMQS